VPNPKLTAAELALMEAHAALARKDNTAVVDALARASAAGASPKITARPHALALSELGRHAEAIEVFRPLFAKAQKDGTVVNLMGVLLKRAGRLQKAAEVLELARKLRPQDLSAWQNLGNVHEALGNPEKAAFFYRGGSIGSINTLPLPGPLSNPAHHTRNKPRFRPNRHPTYREFVVRVKTPRLNPPWAEAPASAASPACPRVAPPL
jgi:tetratricopeptide (TPR) repeat protein